MVTPLVLLRMSHTGSSAVASPVMSTAIWGVALRWWVRLIQGWARPLWAIMSRTRAAAVTHARVQANMLIMAPTSMMGPRRGAPAAVARALMGEALWSSVPADAGK